MDKHIEELDRQEFETWFISIFHPKHMNRDKYGNYQFIDANIAFIVWKERGKALLAKLEAAQKERDDLLNQEFQQRLANAEHQLYMKDLAIHNIKASRKTQFRKRLAAEAALSAANERMSKPVEFPDCDIGAVSHMAHWYSEKQCEAWVSGVEFSKKQIKAAGFTVEGE